MELIEGYKQTEVGVIPEDWDMCKLGDKSIKVGSGITPTGGERVYKKEGRPLLRSQNVGRGNLLMDDIAYIDDKTHATFKDTEIKAYDVFLNITGASIGRSAVADNRVLGGNVNQHVCIIRTNPEQLDPFFLSYFLLSAKGQAQIDSFQAGGNRQGLNLGQIKSFDIPLPPTIQEQRAIAAALGDMDALITSLDTLIAKKRDIKQGAMQELLTGKKRLGGFSAEWKDEVLGNCLSSPPEYGVNAAAIPYDDNLPIYIRITDITEEGKFSRANLSSVQTSQVAKYQLVEGDLVFARTGASTGKTYLYNRKDGEMVFAGFLIRIKVNSKKLNPVYLFYHTRTAAYWNWVALMSTRSGQPGINGTEYAQMPLLLPPIDEQNAIAEILTDIDNEIAALEQKRAKYQLLKQGVMQELLTGKTRLL